MATIDSGSMNKKQGSTTAKGSYNIVEDGNHVKIQVSFSVKKTGVSGTGKGAMAFALLDSNGERVFKVDKGFTVGAELDGLAKKEFDEQFTIFGNKWSEVTGVAFNVEVTKDTIGIPNSANEWKDLFGSTITDIWGGLGSGETKEIAGWLLKKLK